MQRICCDVNGLKSQHTEPKTRKRSTIEPASHYRWTRVLSWSWGKQEVYLLIA